MEESLCFYTKPASIQASVLNVIVKMTMTVIHLASTLFSFFYLFIFLPPSGALDKIDHQWHFFALNPGSVLFQHLRGCV